MAQKRPRSVVQEVAKRLRCARLALGLSQVTVARGLDLKPSTWCVWESGENLPDPLVMARFGDVYGITTDWIYRGRTEALPPEIVVIVLSIMKREDS